jgi:hypothetical protein
LVEVGEDQEPGLFMAEAGGSIREARVSEAEERAGALGCEFHGDDGFGAVGSR